MGRLLGDADPAGARRRRDAPRPPLRPSAPAPLQLDDSARVTVRLRAGRNPGRRSRAGASRRPAGIEKLVEPFHDPDFAAGAGYDAGSSAPRSRCPGRADARRALAARRGGHVLRYQHFSLVMHKPRRLALFTAVQRRRRPARTEPSPAATTAAKASAASREHDLEKWFTDPRIPAAPPAPGPVLHQGPRAFDKGHIVRRDDVAWGTTYEEVRRANGDTYHVTNCSPQVARFNQSPAGRWGRLEK